jgi:hypothetical protein
VLRLLEADVLPGAPAIYRLVDTVAIRDRALRVVLAVPTQTTFGFFGSMTTLAIEYDASLSKTGVHVVPAFVVFHTPPDATATYHVRLSRG